MKNNKEIAISEIEKAEELIKKRDEQKFAEYITKLKELDEEYGFELYIPVQPMPIIKIRRKVNA